MANATPSRLGQVNAAGDPLALFLKVFGGEVLTTFNRMSAFRQNQLLRTISSGKSAQFPALGIADAYVHTPGDEILGQKIKANERVINIEGMLVSPIFIPNIDEAMNHYDVRGPYGQDIAQALAKRYDKNVAFTQIMAARQTTPNVQGVFAGDTLTSFQNNALYSSDGTVLFNGFGDGMALLDSRDVPREGRTQYVRPTQLALLIKSEKPIDRRYSAGDDLGGYSQGELYRMWGAPLVMTNNLEAVNLVGDTSQPALRQHDFSVTQGLLAHKSASGTVALRDVTMEGEYDIRRQGWLMLGKYLCGHDILRPEAAFELRTGAPAG